MYTQAKNGVVHVIDSVLLPLFQTVVDIAASFEQFSILVKAVDQQKLTQVLSGEGPFTVFAPNDDAFEILLTALDITISDLLAIPSLKDILLYHVIGDYLLTPDLLAKGEKNHFVTLTSDRQTITVTQNNNSEINILDQQRSLTGISSIYLPNIQAKNGVAHAIDRVLLPLFQTVVDIAASFDKFSILVKAVDSQRLTQTLSGYGPFTVMAPTNDAFDILLKALGITIDDLLAIPSLSDILLYHVIGDFLFTSDILEERNITTLTPDGQTMTVVQNNISEINVLDQQNSLTGIPTITLGNVQAKNGIAHVIDRVLLPLFQTVWDIANSFDKFNLLLKAVDVAKLTDTLKEDGPFTVFAPTNGAFDILLKFLSPLDVTFEDILKLPSLRDIILYHVIGDFLLTPDLTQQQHFNTLTPDAQTINIIVRGNSELSILDQQRSLTGIAKVALSDVQAKNGVAHVIDRVLLPLFQTVVAIAESFDKFSILVRAVYSRGLDKYLSGYGPFTVFAPTNDAFFRLFAEININIDDLLNIPHLDQILLYHVFGTYVETDDLILEKLPTINGQTVKAVKEHSALSIIDAQNDASYIVLSDVKAKNGIAHVIDRVLIPLFDNLAHIGYSFKDYSIAMRAFEITDSVDFPLRAPGPFTAFAPTNQALLILMDQLRITLEQLYALPMLKRVLFGHVIPGLYLAQDFVSGNYETLNGYKYFVDTDHLDKSKGNGFVVNGMHVIDPQEHVAHVLFGNVEAFNGVVHVIDRVLVMRFESIMEVAEAIDDYSILVKLIYAAGIEELLRFEADRLGPITAFAPNNAAFHRLMFELKINFYDLVNMPKLREILYYHLVNAHLLSTDFNKFKDGGELVTMFGQGFYINSDSHHKEVNDGFDVRGIRIVDAQSDTSFTLLGNVQTNNGVVHVIDRVLIPLFDSVVEIGSQFEEYSILIDLLRHADGGPNHASLFEFLSDPNEGPFTVFVPNNEAFEELMHEIHVELVDLENMPNLRDVVLYHVTNAYLLAEDMEALIGDAPILELEQMNGQLLHIYTDGVLPVGFEVTDIHCIDQQHNSDDTILGNAEVCHSYFDSSSFCNPSWHTVRRQRMESFIRLIMSSFYYLRVSFKSLNHFPDITPYWLSY